MILSNDLLFVHVPKTAGTSVRDWLLDHLRPPILHVHPNGKRFDTDRARITWMPGDKHANLVTAEPLVRMFTGRDLADLPMVIAGVRNPYDREVAWFSYLDSPVPDMGFHLRGERWGTFEEFVARDTTLDRRLEHFYEIRARPLANLRLVRTEHLEQDLTDAMTALGIATRRAVPRLNASRHDDYRGYYTPETEQAVYERYRWYFDQGLYERLRLPGRKDPPATFENALMSGPVRLSGMMRGLHPDGWASPDLTMTVLPTAPVRHLTLRCQVPREAGSGIPMMATIGAERHLTDLTCGPAMEWTLPCPGVAGQRIRIAFQTGRIWIPNGLGLGPDERRFGFRPIALSFR